MRASKADKANDLAVLLATKRLVVVCGSGGVGKTTTSAAMAIAAAQAGRKVLVLTIDPARRLAASLGLTELGNDPRKVDPALFQARGMPMKGELWAMMLDTKRSFDDAVRRHAPRPEVAQRVLDNTIYQQISDALSGTQEYMAMEQLSELTRDDTYDLLVVDTPPTQHALDFLDSPDRMIGVLDSGVLKKVFGGAAQAGKSYFGWLRRSTKMVASLFERVTGGEFFTDMVEFFSAFDELYEAMRNSSKRVKALLKGRDAVFVLVTSPQPSHMQEANYFLSRIDSYGVTLGGFIVNRVHSLADGTVPAGDAAPAPGQMARRLRASVPSLKANEQLEPLLHSLFAAWQRYAAMARQDATQIAQLEARTSVWVKQVPYFEADIHDLTGLDTLNRYLFSDPRSAATERAGS